MLWPLNIFAPLPEMYESQQPSMREDDRAWSGCPQDSVLGRLGRAGCSGQSLMRVAFVIVVALQECVGQSMKLETRSAECADTKSCLGSPPLLQFSMTCRGHRERCPPLLWVSGCWKMLR